MPRFKDLTGQKFGRLTPLTFTLEPNGGAYWSCRCDCGGTKTVRGAQLTNGNTRSCGCLRREKVGALQRTHGLARAPGPYRRWVELMKKPGFALVWMDYPSFRDHALKNGWKPGYKLVRKTREGGFAIDNILWVPGQRAW